jgi:putative ABC transport system ATP-binding protein
VFQRPTLFAGTVRDNLAVAAPGAADAVYEDALDRVTLGREFLDRTGDDLSGGEAQRACIARALLTDPHVLLLDEATSALDPEARRTIERLACDLARQHLTVLWVTHDLAQVGRIADRVVVVLDGRIASDAARERFLSDQPTND